MPESKPGEQFDAIDRFGDIIGSAGTMHFSRSPFIRPGGQRNDGQGAELSQLPGWLV